MVRLQYELLDALSKATISGKCWQVLITILRNHEKKVYLTIQQFSYRTGIAPPNICRVLRHLLERNIILKYVENERIYYTINLNCEAWTEAKIVEHEIEEVVEEVEVIPVSKSEIVVSKYFFDFYNRYPNKVNFEFTKKKWAELNPDDELAQHILERLDLFIESDGWKEKDGKYIPSAHTFIMYKRWQDEPKNKKGWKD